MSLEEVCPGARLAEPILDHFGNLMLPAGAEISEHILDSLKQRGIATVHILTEAAEMSEEERARQLQSIEKRLDFLFRHSADSKANAQLKGLILAYRLEQIK
jgi:hypothetical protein